jgi:hypothetical protein
MPMRIAGCTVLGISVAAAGLAAQAPAAEGARVARITACVVTLAEYADANTVNAVAASGAPVSFVAVDSPLAYALPAKPDTDFATHRHRRVIINGHLEESAPGTERGSSNPRTPSGAAGAAVDGSAAHEPGDAVQPGTGRRTTAETASNARPLRRLPTLNVTSISQTGEACDERGAPVRPGVSAGTSKSTPAPASRSDTPPSAMVVTGCLMRDESSAALTLQKASAVPSASARASAVPGSRPSSEGTGTVEPVQTEGRSGVTTRSYLIVTPPAALEGQTGRQVEITGELTEAAEREGDAHESTPSSRLAVTSFRVLRSQCP